KSPVRRQQGPSDCATPNPGKVRLRQPAPASPHWRKEAILNVSQATLPPLKSRRKKRSIKTSWMTGGEVVGENKRQRVRLHGNPRRQIRGCLHNALGTGGTGNIHRKTLRAQIGRRLQ